MKTNKISIIILLVLLFSCQNRESVEGTQEEDEIAIEKAKTEEIITFPYSQNETFKKWRNYYITNVDKDFKTEKFELSSESKIMRTQGNIYGVFDKEFDKSYIKFLIYSPNKENYLDFDSYHWFYDSKNKELNFEIDQEINLVNISKKKIERIGFMGSTGWVEDAYWENDSIIILLEYTTDKIPIITEINTITDNRKTFIYMDTLKNESNYLEKRILRKIKIE